MNEINETFTKKINGFECSIKNWFEKAEYDSLDHCTIYTILKNKKWVKIELIGEMARHSYSDPSVHTWEVKNSSSWNYSDGKNFIDKLFISKGNIWQILQDEWHRRFEDE